MNRILGFIFFIAFTFAAQAQGNLQFNQPRLIIYTSSIPLLLPSIGVVVYDSTNIVVPVGKALKIESMSANFVMNSSGIANFPTDRGTDILISIDDVLVNSSIVRGLSLPLWLPAGTFKVKVYGGSPPSNPSRMKLAISALEFNIVP